MRPKTQRSPFVLCFYLAVCLLAGAAHADNIDLPASAVHVDTLAGVAANCGDYSFVDNVLNSTSGLRTFRLLTADIDFSATMQLRASVDPLSGTALGTVNAVSVDSGSFSLSGSSTELGIVGERILLGRVVGAREQNQFGTFFRFVIDLTYVHPSLEAAIGPVGSAVYRIYDIPWVGPPFDVPWQTDINPGSCYTTSPDIDLFADPVPGPSPITFKASGTTYDFPSSACPFIPFGTQVPIDVEYTFDANATDLNPDPDVGIYVSCDDTYGSSSGARVTVADFDWRWSCVAIRVENDSENGSPGTIAADLYVASLLNDGDTFGALVGLEDDDGVGFSDDSLPATPPPLTSLPAPPGLFVAFGEPSINLFLTNVCELWSDPVTLTAVGDADFDGVADTIDNCIMRSNARQRDSDGDGYGNACDADLNNDDIVNASDLGHFRASFFSSGNEDADFNSDGVVNATDLGRLRELFFAPPGPSGLAP